jgi:imidazolonepropionase-like amidohydrolase
VAGVDFIKTYTRITPELFKALLDEANALNLKVTAHLGLTDAETASRLGVASIEHMTGIPEAANPRGAEKLYAEHRASFFRGWNAFEKSWATLDSTNLARVAATLVDRNVILIPTLVLHDTFSRLDDPAVLLDPDLKSVPDSEIKRWNLPDLKARAGWTDADYVAFRASRPMQDLFVREFRVAGGVIAAGTDATNQMLPPGPTLHTEMALLVNAGLTPSDALRAATVNGARLLGADSIGTLACGQGGGPRHSRRESARRYPQYQTGEPGDGAGPVVRRGFNPENLVGHVAASPAVGVARRHVVVCSLARRPAPPGRGSG